MNTDIYSPSPNWWLAHFSLRLMELRPDMSLHAATQRGVASFAHASDLEPEEAADIFAELHPIREAILR